MDSRAAYCTRMEEHDNMSLATSVLGKKLEGYELYREVFKSPKHVLAPMVFAQLKLCSVEVLTIFKG